MSMAWEWLYSLFSCSGMVELLNMVWYNSAIQWADLAARPAGGPGGGGRGGPGAAHLLGDGGHGHRHGRRTLHLQPLSKVPCPAILTL